MGDGFTVGATLGVTAGAVFVGTAGVLSSCGVGRVTMNMINATPTPSTNIPAMMPTLLPKVNSPCSGSGDSGRLPPTRHEMP